MRLPFESWTNTMRKLGLRANRSCRPVPAHRKPRHSQLEVLERRELLAGEIAVQYGEGTPVADGGGPIDLGSTVVGEQVNLTFTIYNEHEEEDLTIELGSFDLPAGFTLTQAPDSVIVPWSYSSFTVQLDAQVSGDFSGELSFDNSDSNEGTYNFAIEGTVIGLPPEIVVKNGEQSDIEDGSGSEDFGSTLAGTPVSRTFTIENTGSGALTIDTGSFSLPAGFSLTTPPAASVSPGGNTSFTVHLDADVADSYSGEISFNNGDSDESPFSFTVSGTVEQADPEINVQNSAGIDLLDGTGSQSFGTVAIGSPISRTFTIQNTGTRALAITTASFSLPSGFTLMQAPPASIAAGSYASFTVRLDATAGGTFSGELSFNNSDADESPYNFNISGAVQESGGNGLSTSIGLLNDTGSSNTDFVTSDPTLEASVSGEFPFAKVQFDVSGDGFSDAELAFTAPDTPQTFDPTSVNSQLETYEGEVTIKHRWVQYANPGGSVISTGSWTPFTFTLEHPPEIAILVDTNVPVPDGVGSISFGSTEIGVPLTKTLIIKNIGDNPLNISGSFTYPNGFSVETTNFDPQLSPNEQTSITIQLDAEIDGVFSGEFSFTSNDPDESPYDFTVSGQVTNLEPEVKVTINSGTSSAEILDQHFVDWGTTVVGSPLTRTFTITNTGTDTLNLDTNSLILPSGFTLISPALVELRIDTLALTNDTGNSGTDGATADGAMAEIHRDVLVNIALLGEARTVVFAAAQVAYWTTETAALTARQSAEGLALADLLSADYASRAAAVVSIDTALNLPWTAYQTQLAAAKSNWWLNSDRDGGLALSAARAAAAMVYQATVNTAFTAWAASTAAAERQLVQGVALADYNVDSADVAAHAAYEQSHLLYVEAWHNAFAAGKRIYRSR